MMINLNKMAVVTKKCYYSYIPKFILFYFYSSKSTGVPILGVVNQPFAFFDSTTKNWTGKVHWGCLFNETSFTNIEVEPPSRKIPKGKF